MKSFYEEYENFWEMFIQYDYEMTAILYEWLA
jgi:hypothetical protein